MNIQKISFIISIIGILILIIISTVIEPKHIQINKLTLKDLNKEVKIIGTIINIKTINQNFHILTLKDSSSKINVIINNKLNLKVHQSITITGILTKYNNQFQIQSNKIINNGL